MYNIRKLKRFFFMFGIVICLFFFIYINLFWMKVFFGLNLYLILNNVNRKFVVVKKLMEIKNVYDVNVDDLFNLLKEMIGVFFRMEEMFFEEI